MFFFDHQPFVRTLRFISITFFPHLIKGLALIKLKKNETKGTTKPRKIVGLNLKTICCYFIDSKYLIFYTIYIFIKSVSSYQYEFKAVIYFVRAQ